MNYNLLVKKLVNLPREERTFIAGRYEDENGNRDVSSSLFTELRGLPESSQHHPIESRDFPNRKNILKQLHQEFFKTEEVALLQKLADNSEPLLLAMKDKLSDIRDKEPSENKRRFLFVLRCMQVRDTLQAAISHLAAVIFFKRS